jgi:hypothetical protein
VVLSEKKTVNKVWIKVNSLRWVRHGIGNTLPRALSGLTAPQNATQPKQATHQLV